MTTIRVHNIEIVCRLYIITFTYMHQYIQCRLS